MNDWGTRPTSRNVQILLETLLRPSFCMANELWQDSVLLDRQRCQSIPRSTRSFDLSTTAFPHQLANWSGSAIVLQMAWKSSLPQPVAHSPDPSPPSRWLVQQTEAACWELIVSRTRLRSEGILPGYHLLRMPTMLASLAQLWLFPTKSKTVSCLAPSRLE